MKPLFFTLIILTSFHGFAQENTIDKVCEQPRSKLYQSEDLNQPMKMQLIVDYARLNASKDNYRGVTYFPGVLAVEEKKSKVKYQPVVLSVRGNSRKMYCAAPPLRMQFVDQAIGDKIEKQLAEAKVKSGTADYLKQYYDLLKAEGVDNAKSAKSPSHTIFSKLGDDVKIVTHCGNAYWEHVGGKDTAAQNTKIMSEYYLYKMLAEFRLPIESARLAHITYFNADGTSAYSDINKSGGTDHFKLAFFREPPTSVARRCGLLSKKPENTGNDYYGKSDKASSFQADFVNKFAFNNDYTLAGQNMNKFYNKDGDIFYGPYDFDLSGVIDLNYPKNSDTIEGNVSDFIRYLSNEKQEWSIPMAKRALAARPAMQRILDQAQLPESNKKRFQEWLTKTMKGLEKFVKDAN